MFYWDMKGLVSKYNNAMSIMDLCVCESFRSVVTVTL